MNSSFYFYDLETSGISPRYSRIMQFGGQRTDMDLKPVGQPDIIYIKITPDILPDPDAVLITGITPQKTLQDGITEAEFLKYFYLNIATPGTIFTGFNSVRFDDEFVRFTNYRNFYDAYEWQWQNNRSRWDILDVSRMTRALRPKGIEWPFDGEGRPSNKLTLLSSANNLLHNQAHDAFSDVQATIDVARLIKQKQPRLFDYLLNTRDKKSVEQLVTRPDPFVYTSGRYSSEFEKTTVAVTLTDHPTQKGSVYVYDLRFDPTPFAKKSVKELADELSKTVYQEGEARLPVKQLQFNRCPAVAPMSVLDDDSLERLKIDMAKIKDNLKALLAFGDFGDRLKEAVKIKEQKRQTTFVIDETDVDSQLYDGFFNDDDRTKMAVVRAADENGLADLSLAFDDYRLPKLLTLYKARQYPKSLNADEQKVWDEYRAKKLLGGDDQSEFADYVRHLNELAADQSLGQDKKYLLEELRFYAESILPYDG